MGIVDTIVVGAGQAGLAMSRALQRRGREHLVLERARVAERWRSERWDGLRFQSPNWSIGLPGCRYDGAEPDAFATREEVLHFIEAYASRIAAPVRTMTNVSSLRRTASGAFELQTGAGVLTARHVVVATGPYQRPHRPGWHRALPGKVLQLDASEYRNAAALPGGAVLVAGSGASGCQIADELLEAGRPVFLSVGRHARVPRRHRGRDVFWWRLALGDLDRTAAQARPEERLPGPLLTGAHGGYEVDLRRSAGRGVNLLGRLAGASGGTLAIKDDLEANLRQGDAHRRAFVARIEDHVRRHGLAASMPAADGADPVPATPMASPGRLDLAAHSIAVVIWATGYAFDFGWIHLPVLAADGAPVHTGGATAVPGLYFLGLPWLHSARSSFLCGVGDDAERIARMIDAAGPTRRGAGDLARAARRAA